ncbi:MAG: MATE family efflux transporter [Lentisphaeria bacterium]
MKKLSHSKEVLLMSLPVIGGEICQILFGVGDVLVAGRYSIEVLGALGVAAAFYFPFTVFGLGIISAMGPLKARRLGAGECTKLVTSNSVLVAFAVGLCLALLQYLTSQYLVPLMNYEPEFQKLIQRYLEICSLAVVPTLVFSSLRELLLVRGHIIFPNALILAFNFFNIALNYYLMFPCDLGITGAAIATVTSRLFMMICIWIYSLKHCQWNWKYCKKTVREVLKIGIPSGSAVLVIAGSFAVVAMLAGKISITAAAANNILIQLTSLTYMIPMAISAVTAVKVGESFGKKSFKDVRLYTLASLKIVSMAATICATIFLVFPEFLIGCFTDQQEVITYGKGMLFFVVLYQLPDAIQAILYGTLRGLGRTVYSLTSAFVAVWIIGMPVSYYLAWPMQMEASGLWGGLATGLTALCLLFAGYIYFLFKKLRNSLNNQIPKN